MTAYGNAEDVAIKSFVSCRVAKSTAHNGVGKMKPSVTLQITVKMGTGSEKFFLL